MLVSSSPESLPVRTPEDVVRVRTAARRFATELKLGIVDQTKLVTAGARLREIRWITDLVETFG